MPRVIQRKRSWEEGLSQDPCCIVNYSDNKPRKVCLDSLSCRLLLWQLGRDICSAQPCAVGVDDHTFLMSILKHFLSRKTSLASAPSESFGTKGVSSSEVGPVRLGDAGAGGKPSSIIPHPWPPKAGRTGICLSCFSSFSAIMVPCFSFQFLIGLEIYSHSTGEREKNSQPLCLTQASVFIYYSRLLSYFVNSMKTRISWIKKMFCPCWLLCLSMSILRCPGLLLQGSFARVAPCRRWYK